MDHPHASPPTAARRLDDDGISHRLGDASNLNRVIGQLTLGARDTRHTRFDHGLFGGHFVAHHANAFRRGADELKTAFLHPLSKVSVFTQKAISRVNGFSVSDFSRRNDGRHVEVTQSRRRRANAHRLLCQFHVFGFAVSLGIDHNGLDPEFPAGALNSEGDFAPVGNENFFEHGNWRLASVDHEHDLAVLNRLPVVAQDLSDNACFIGLNFIEDLHRFNNANGFTRLDGIP